MKTVYKVGDYVYYRKSCGYNCFETIPAIVLKVTEKRLKLNDTGEPENAFWASKSKCEHQI